jgi:quinoprotein glucose dehydrogenase
VATGGVVVFNGGTADQQLLAFDSTTGKELWAASPGFDVGGAAVVYRGANGKQYVVVSGPRLVAYALP